jgi:hypothetical protein
MCFPNVSCRGGYDAVTALADFRACVEFRRTMSRVIGWVPRIFTAVQEQRLKLEPSTDLQKFGHRSRGEAVGELTETGHRRAVSKLAGWNSCGPLFCTAVLK